MQTGQTPAESRLAYQPVHGIVLGFSTCSCAAAVHANLVHLLVALIIEPF
jgi:hypothetical protein